MKARQNLTPYLVVAAAVLLAVVVISLSGCESPAKFDEAITQTQKEREVFREKIAVVKAELAKPDVDPELREKLLKGLVLLEEGEKKVAVAEKALVEQREKLISENPGEQIKGVSEVVGQTVGGPYGAIVGLIGTAIGGIVSGYYRSKYTNTKAAAISAIGSVSMAEAAGLFQWDDKLSAALNDSQTDAAKALVAEADMYYDDTLKIVKAGKRPPQ
jgi:chorismate mutase